MDKCITFPELRALMAKHGLTQQDMGKIIGNTYRTFGKKLNGEADFTFSEMWKIKEYFKSFGSRKNTDEIFFDWKLTKVNTR